MGSSLVNVPSQDLIPSKVLLVLQEMRQAIEDIEVTITNAAGVQSTDLDQIHYHTVRIRELLGVE